jgi:UDP-glucuronate 4-epimerase
VLVTGAAGFIGFHVVQALLAAGAAVAGFDSLNDYYDVSLKTDRLAQLPSDLGFQFVRARLEDPDALAGLFASFRPDCVIHLAAQAGVRYSLENPAAYVDANISGFLAVLEACRRYPVAHLIYASSSSVYGLNEKTPFSEHDGADHPVSLYGATKRANELMAHSYAHLFGIAATGLRFFTVYGPWGRPDMAYYLFTKAIFAGEPIKLFNQGRMRRDFTFIDDVVTAILRLIPRPPGFNPDYDFGHPDPASARAPHRVYNIGNHTPVELDRMILAIEYATGRSARRHLLPMQPGDVVETFADVDDLMQAVGFSPSTDIETGIARFVAWYRTYHSL